MKQHSGIKIKLIMIVSLLVFVILPLCIMFRYISAADISKIINSVQFSLGLKNSIRVSVIATIISLLVAFTLAWCITRTGIRHKGVFSVVLVLPMLIPSISHGTGLVILFGTNGIITKLVGLNSSIYGFWGIVFGSVMYSFPIAFLMIADVLRYEDYSPYEAASILGIPKKNQIFVITLPYLWKPLISVVFTIFTIIFTDYGIPLSIGGKYLTLPVIMYQEVVGQLNFGKGSVIGFILLMPAIITFVIDLLSFNNESSQYIKQPYTIRMNKYRDLISVLICSLFTIFIIFINLSFILLTFTVKYPINLSFTIDNIIKTFNMNGGVYLINSILIASIVAISGSVIAFIIAYLTKRMQSFLSRFLHLITIISLAIPGIVLGLSYVLFFKETMLYGTLLILIVVNIVHFIASPYLMMYNTLGKININLEAVGQTLGISRILMIKDVILPQTKTTLLEMGSYFFVNSMITISAVSFLATINNKPFSLMINQFEALMTIECSAVVSLIILFINVTVKCVIYLLKRYIAIKER